MMFTDQSGTNEFQTTTDLQLKTRVPTEIKTQKSGFSFKPVQNWFATLVCM